MLKNRIIICYPELQPEYEQILLVLHLEYEQIGSWEPIPSHRGVRISFLRPTGLQSGHLQHQIRS